MGGGGDKVVRFCILVFDHKVCVTLYYYQYIYIVLYCGIIIIIIHLV